MTRHFRHLVAAQLRGSIKQGTAVCRHGTKHHLRKSRPWESHQKPGNVPWKSIEFIRKTGGFDQDIKKWPPDTLFELFGIKNPFFLYSGPSVELNRVASLTNYWRVWGKFHASSGELNMMLLIRWEDIAAWDQVRWKTLAVQSHSYFFIQENTARNREVRIMIIWENRVWSSCSMFPLKMTIWGVYVPRPHFQTPFQKKDNFQRFHVLGVRVHQRCLLSLTWTRAAKPSDWWSFIIKNVVDPTINHP